MSSDEEGVRRPGRAGNESPAPSDNANESGANNLADLMDEDDNDDLFGSDGEGGLDDIEYASYINATSTGY
jgi:RNA polymerase-associated protein LEO1